MNIFERAARLKLRFDTSQGGLSVEDLWDLPLESDSGVSLDALAIQLSRAVKAGEEDESFVKKRKTTAQSKLELQFEILKHIIEVKLANIVKAEKVEVTKQTKERIRGIIAAKKDKVLEETSVEELEEMLDDL